MRKSHNGLKFGGMIQFTMKRITVMKCPHAANVHISDLGRPRVLSFFERLVSFASVHDVRMHFMRKYINLHYTAFPRIHNGM